MSSQSYRVFSIGGHPVLATPDVAKRLRLVGIARYHAFSLTRVSFRLLLEFTTAIGMDGLFCSYSSDPVRSVTGFRFDQWLVEARAVLGKGPGTVAVLVWHSPKRWGRVYVHLIDPDGVPSGFAKIAVHPEDKEGLLNEVSALSWVSQHVRPPAWVPRVLATGSFQGSFYGIFEPLPTNYRLGHVAFEKLRTSLSAFAGRPSSWPSARLGELTWWRRFEATMEASGGFVRELKSLLHDDVKLCRIHGDLKPGNVCCSNGKFWIFDWESSCENGPVLTDEVSYYLSSERSKFLSKPTCATASLLNRFAASSSTRRRLDLMLSLAFLHVTGCRPASVAMTHWAS